jgi:arsenate reductase
MNKVLFVCIHNSGRSQMAEAFFNRYAAGEALAYSAGTRPAIHVDRNVVEAMREIGIDMGKQMPKVIIPSMIEDADRVVTMGCMADEVCTAMFIPTEEWQIEDPEGQSLEKVRVIRDEIQNRVQGLIQDISIESCINGRR